MAASITQKYFVATRAEPSAGDESITITTINRDREGDSVLPEGGDFASFMKNPVLMWAHGGQGGYSSIPIGSVTGLTVEPGVGVRASFRFLENDPFADRIANAYRQNVIRASSIGFKPLQATPNGQGYDHEKWSLLELSLCSVPMNPECIRTLKSLGLSDEEASAPEAPVVDAIDSTKTELEAVQKRGRVLSAVNESKLRAALDALNAVLAQLMPMEPDMPEDDMPEEMPVDVPMPEDMAKAPLVLDAAETYSLTLAEEDLADDLRITLADDEVLTFTFDTPTEPTFSVDPAAMREVVMASVRERMQDALVGPVGDAVQRALDHARGRVQ